MRIPPAFTIRGKLWKVEYKWRLTTDDGKVCDGLCDSSIRTIYLTHGLGEDKPQIFIHEYIHALLFEYGFYVTNLDPQVEEMLCQIISTELWEKFRFRWKKIV